MEEPVWLCTLCAALPHLADDKVHRETILYMHYVHIHIPIRLHAALASFAQIPQCTSLVFKSHPVCRSSVLI